MVTMDPSPKTIELHANKIQWNQRFWRASWQQEKVVLMQLISPENEERELLR